MKNPPCPRCGEQPNAEFNPLGEWEFDCPVCQIHFWFGLEGTLNFTFCSEGWRRDRDFPHVAETYQWGQLWSQ
jgi:hypothetical protein